MKIKFYLGALMLTGVAAAALAHTSITIRAASAHASTELAALATPTPLPLVTPTPSIDDPNEVITVETELVNLNVRVIDRNNRPINNIQQSEFKIFEDNVPQTIDFFSRSEVPTNYELVIDNSGSLRQQLEKVIEASKIIVSTNRPLDETAIIRFVGKDKISIQQPFTSVTEDLMDSLDNMYIEGGQTAIIDAVYLAVENIEDHLKGSNQNDRKRRAIILVSDGEDRDSFYTEKQLFDQLRESDVQIYVIGFVADLSTQGGFIGKSAQGKAKTFLERLATETGGKAYFPAALSELPDMARDISSELRTQYSIGYIPTNDARDGTVRNIKVSIADGPNKQRRIAVTRTSRKAEGGKP